MPKIWFVNQFANTPEMPGHTRQYEISKGLYKKGWEIDIFASDFNLSKRTFLKLKPFKFCLKENIDGVKWYWLRVTSYKKNDLQRVFNMMTFSFHLIYKLIIKYFFDCLKKEKPDLIIASSPHLPAALAALLVAKLFKIKFILEVRDLWPEVLIDLGGKSKKSLQIKFFKFIEYFLYKESKIVIILASGAKNYVLERGAKEVVWLPNGPDLKLFDSYNSKFVKSFFSKEKPFTITYAGAHGIANNLDNIINAAKLLKNYPIKFLFVGDGIEKRRLIEESRGLKNIEFLDPIPKFKMPDLLYKSDAIIFSLKNIKLFTYGVSPNKLYDAYASSKPVINTVSGSIANEINKWNVGINANPDDPNSLADAILYLMNMSKEKRIAMGERARELAVKYYSREKIINKLDIILKAFI